MVKQFFIAMLGTVLFSTTTVSAQTMKEAYFYGEKAGKSLKTPCKGECVRICAHITYNIGDIGPIGGGAPVDPTRAKVAPRQKQTTVTVTLEDADGNVITEERRTYVGNENAVREEIDREIIENGGIEE